MSNIIDFTGGLSDLTKAVSEAGHLVLADFYAPWCPGCRRLGQLLPGIANDNQDVTFLKVDIEQNEELKDHFGVTSIPVVKFLKVDGGNLKELAHVQGPNVAEIKKQISENK
ncbi:Thioredoxin [Tritrichomonas foetus]|uniref:Thioredoxin n=1 Tax=Tritrichomonas foetus TaxID=1144522 RepID=A0A1J4KWJ3_9EUKA|nr:Thioredoxin [Tritrichomonas foetus]|eukprot:OHT15530.1 Thioredoxin [Tritrichomonas foetus]